MRATLRNKQVNIEIHIYFCVVQVDKKVFHEWHSEFWLFMASHTLRLYSIDNAKGIWMNKWRLLGQYKTPQFDITWGGWDSFLRVLGKICL